MSSSLEEIDSLEVTVVVDNEVDPLSPYHNEGLQVRGRGADIAINSPHHVKGRGEATQETRQDQLCCGAHGLSLMITAVKGKKRRTILFDIGPEEDVWQRNVERLRPDIAQIEVIQLSHWHRDHSGGMLRAIQMINSARSNSPATFSENLAVDLHPARPDYRGIFAGKPVSMEADPSFEEITAAGATVRKSDQPHTVLDDMFLISGEIPRVTTYEQGIPIGIRFDAATGKWEKDTLIQDERLLMCNLKGKGIVMFTGCSHAGVVNASKHAVELGGGSVPLYAVVGGFHLVDGDKTKLESTVKDLKELNPKLLLPGHCSGWRVKMEIERQMPGVLAPSFVGTTYLF